MGGFVMAAQLILGLSIIVTLHELGHFLAARAFGIRVEKFYLFFDAWGFKLFKFKKGETEYGIGWLPLGGYVKIAGMIDESMDKEALKQEPQDYEFRSKPAWQRLIVMLGGVIMNFVLGVFIFAFITLYFEREYLPTNAINNGVYSYELGQQLGFKTGDKVIAVNGKSLIRFKDIASINNLMGSTITIDRNGEKINIVVPEDFYRNFKSSKPLFIESDNFRFSIDSISPNSNALKAGLMKGDSFLKIDSLEVTSFGDFRNYLINHPNKTISALVLRNSDTLTMAIDIDSLGVIGFIPSTYPYVKEKYTFTEGFSYGIKDGIAILGANIKGMGKIFSGKEKATESLQGPIGIATIYGGEWIWHKFWFLTGMISFVLAFMNLLPIPALDGGHVVFLSFEAITRRKLSDKFMERAQMAGMIILLALMVFVIGNDIWKHIIN